MRSLFIYHFILLSCINQKISEMNVWAVDLSRRPIDRLQKNRRVRSRRFDRMKLALIIFHRSFQSHCPTVGPNFSMTVINYLRSSEPSLTHQTTADHLRISFSPDTSSSTGPIFHPIFHPPLRSVRQWDAGFSHRFWKVYKYVSTWLCI